MTVFGRIIVIALVLAPCSVAGQNVRPAPSLTLKDINGRTLRLDKYRGKVVLLNFWATWCPPCRVEVPDLIQLQHDHSRGLQIVGVTYPPQTRAQVRRFARQFKINYPVALGTRKTKALFYPGGTLPITVIIDRSGNVREVIEGILYAEEFDAKVKPLLHSSMSR
jgi:thiol-disulfide isomerase/thioredoxin